MLVITLNIDERYYNKKEVKPMEKRRKAESRKREVESESEEDEW
jgi:hypothetical protein